MSLIPQNLLLKEGGRGRGLPYKPPTFPAANGFCWRCLWPIRLGQYNHFAREEGPRKAVSGTSAPFRDKMTE